MNLKFFRLFLFVTSLSFLVSCSADDTAFPENATTSAPIITNYEYSTVEIETMALINEYRVSKGLNSLEKINYASVKSEEHDHYMIENNVVNHNDFQARSENIMNTVHAKRVSENIAYNYSSAKGAFDAWLKSEGHRQNIEGDFSHFGIAIRENPVDGKKYFTNIFVKI